MDNYKVDVYFMDGSKVTYENCCEYTWSHQTGTIFIRTKERVIDINLYLVSRLEAFIDRDHSGIRIVSLPNGEQPKKKRFFK